MPEEYTGHFIDWEHMDLKADIQIGKNYLLVDNVVWMKISNEFGAAPEIIFYENDFSPMKLTCFLIGHQGEVISNTFLVSSQQKISNFTRMSGEKIFKNLNPKLKSLYVARSSIQD